MARRHDMSESLGRVLVAMIVLCGTVGCESGWFWGEPEAPVVRRDQDELAERLKMAFIQRHRGDCVDVLVSIPQVKGLGARARAWRLLCEVPDTPQHVLVAKARAWLESNPKEPWARFAIASLLTFDPTTMREAEDLMDGLPDGMPGNDDLWLRLSVYVFGGDYAAARDLIDEHAKVVDAQPELKVLDMALQLRVADAVHDGERRDELLTAAVSEARAVQTRWPELVQAYRLPCECLLTAPPNLAPVDMARKMTELAPRHAHGAFRYWSYLLKAEGKPWEKRKAEVLELVNRAVAVHAGDPEWLDYAMEAYESIGEHQRAAAISERILQKHRASPQAELVRYSRLQRAGDEIQLRPESEERKKALDEWRKAAWAFLDRTTVHDRSLDGLIAMDLFLSYAHDETLSTEDRTEPMIALSRQMRAFELSNPHIVYVAAPMLLVERANAPEEAEALARAGVEFASSYYLAYRRGETMAELEAIAAPLLSDVHRTIGEVLLRRAKADEAEVELQEAIELDPKNARARVLLGTILRERGDLEKARDHLLLALEHASREDRAEVESALFELFEASGKSQSFQDFLDEQIAGQEGRRKHEILAKRQRGPKIMGLVGLVPLGNEPATLATDGKIVIVNVWTTYCKPCIEEMPELERLWDTYYADDPDVEMLTVSADLNPDDARSFRERHGYRIPAYHDRGFADRMGVRAFPTTLFFEREGHLAFRSLDQARADEIAWRVDALR